MKNRSLHFRYLLIVLAIALVCMAILFKMSRTIFVERDKWQAKAEKPLYDTVPVVATRGNILAADGRLLATTMPRYTMYMDFAADGFDRDTFFRYLDPLCRALAACLATARPRPTRPICVGGLPTSTAGITGYRLPGSRMCR